MSGVIFYDCYWHCEEDDDPPPSVPNMLLGEDDYYLTLSVELDQLHQDGRIMRRREFFASAPAIIGDVLSDLDASVPADVIDSFARQMCSLARTIEENSYVAALRMLSLTLTIVTRTAYSLEEEIINRLSRLSAEAEGARRIGPAAKSSIKTLLEDVVIDATMITKGKEFQYCSICLEDLASGAFDRPKKIARMPCSHVYHRDCIVRWLETSHLCPLCRYAMPT